MCNLIYGCFVSRVPRLTPARRSAAARTPDSSDALTAASSAALAVALWGSDAVDDDAARVVPSAALVLAVADQVFAAAAASRLARATLGAVAAADATVTSRGRDRSHDRSHDRTGWSGTTARDDIALRTVAAGTRRAVEDRGSRSSRALVARGAGARGGDLLERATFQHLATGVRPGSDTRAFGDRLAVRHPNRPGWTAIDERVRDPGE